MIRLDFRSSQPIYEQIVMQYKYLVLRGFIKPGDAIPSVRKLALELDVTPGTVAKAYRELENQCVIETIRGKGTFIANEVDYKADEGVIRKVKEDLKTQCMELIYQGLDGPQIIALIEEVLQDLQGKEEQL